MKDYKTMLPLLLFPLMLGDERGFNSLPEPKKYRKCANPNCGERTYRFRCCSKECENELRKINAEKNGTTWERVK